MSRIVALLVTLATLAALVGVWKTHLTAEGMMFGSTEGSLSLLTAVLALVVWLKMMKCLCPCSKGGTSEMH